MKRILSITAVAVGLLLSVIIVRTMAFTPQEQVGFQKQSVKVDQMILSQHLSQAIQLRTISRQRGAQKQTGSDLPFTAFIEWLAVTYPEVHTQLQLDHLGYSLLFKWTGSNAELPAVLLSGHYDVVPVLPGTEQQWTHAPFKGHVDQTHIWGRGAIDDKVTVVSMMEAITLLLKEDFKPQRTVYIAITHDEEIGGGTGTAAVVEKLIEDRAKIAWSLDEGSFLLQGMMPGIKQAVASINVAEKGSLTVDLVARGAGGHSSMPPKETAVGVLAAAILKVQDNPIPGGLTGVNAEMFETIARHMPFAMRIPFANRWLFGALIDSGLSNNPPTNAMLRTTTAPTMLSASIKSNVLAINATGTVNFRLHPRDTTESVVKYLEEIIADERIDIIVRGGRQASRVSSSQTAGFTALRKAVGRTYGSEVISTPGLTIAGTDSKRYEKIVDDAYRFTPILVTGKDLSTMHGTNERVSIENLANATGFFVSLLKME